MIVNMASNATPEEINHVIDRIKECGFQAHVIHGEERTVIGAVGNSNRRSEIEALRAAPGVAEVIQIAHPFKLVSRQLRQTRTVVDVRGIKVGGDELVIIAGPCSVESEDQLMETARGVKAAGADMLRGGAYKPRTSPYDFQGLGVEALRFLRQASRETGLPIVTEVMSETDVEIVAEYADVLQVGARNMSAPAAFTACAVCISCSSDSTEHGPAITTSSSPPTFTPRTSTTVRACRNCRLTSLNGCVI